MKLNKVRLENIRSYSNAEISLPNGTVLLNGNIGCGKSTILLAIEFALFGLSKGELTGAGLLRNGEKNGSVEVNFDINGKNVTVKRTLKRGTAVSQEDGYVLIDGKKTIGTSIELKEKMMELMNYPHDLMSKSNSMIYKYTVYTPQEEMKQILSGDEKYRIDALRRVFGIDKYKRISENCVKFISKLKEKKKQYAGMIADLEEKQRMKDSKLKEIIEIEARMKEISTKVIDANAYAKMKQSEIDVIEKEIRKFTDDKKQLEILQLELKYKLNAIKDNKEKITDLEDEIKEIEKGLGEESKSSAEDSKSLRVKITLIKDEGSKYGSSINKLQANKENSEELKTKISKLDVCHVCGQKVWQDHIKKVHNEEDSKIKDYESKLKEGLLLKTEKEKTLQDLENKLEIAREIERKVETRLLNKEKLELKKKKLVETRTLTDKLKKYTDVLNIKVGELAKKSADTTGVDKRFLTAKREFDDAKQKEKLLEIQKAGFESKSQEITKYCDDLAREINEKLKTRESLLHLVELQSWMEEYFINVMQKMEKKIMSKVHNDFDSLFQRLFEMIVDASEMKVRLNDEFTPVIEQNGHEIDYAFLSGGEKTAAALAYRLALNQVINDIISSIHTKDLLILDEPTDGFSSEQLDRLRNLFDELKIGQIIIVSHEDKIESFVDNVIRLGKKDHVTKVLGQLCQLNSAAPQNDLSLTNFTGNPG